MTTVLVAVSSTPCNVESFLKGQGGDFRWLREDYAGEVILAHDLPREDFQDIQASGLDAGIDVFCVEQAGRRKKLFLADMDATIVAGETLDELAEYAGLKEQISAITARAMRGELDFHAALTARVAMLAGLPVTALNATLGKTIVNAGAREAVQVMRHFGTCCVLVSGGFTFFTGAVAQWCGFDFHHGNNLEIEGGALTGRVIPPILDKEAKLAFLNQYAMTQGIPLGEAITTGDGANDIPMLAAAGCGVGYRAKPLVRDQIRNNIMVSDLTSLLYIQGYSEQDISSALSPF